jgi:hypothetical protein
MARARTARQPQPVEPEDESQEPPGEEPETPATAPKAAAKSRTKSMTKAEAVRQALAAGMDGPQEGTAYIRKEFGLIRISRTDRLLPFDAMMHAA